MMALWLWGFIILLEILIAVILVRLFFKLKPLWQWSMVDCHQHLSQIKQTRLNARQLKQRMEKFDDEFSQLGGLGGWKTKVASMVFKKLFGQK